MTRITHLSWGQIEIEVEGQQLNFRDCKLWPGGARAWEWQETGTEHHPGIQPADVSEILEHGMDVVILTRGVLGQLQIQPETKRMLRERGIEVHTLKTRRAVSLFNELSQKGQRVGGLFHTTC